MADKILDLNLTVYELCTADSGIIPLLEEAGFPDITKPGMLATAGRFMTIPKGATFKKLDLENIKLLFTQHGYTVKEEKK